MKDKILGGIIGLCVGDALGAPVEFESRESLRNNPVTDMRGFGTYNQPLGTWSDDTSMTLCLLDSLSQGLDYTDIMQKFHAWLYCAEYTAHGKVFDVGIATKKAVNLFANGTDALRCGGTSENDNGNGSLMRILPLSFYLKWEFGDEGRDYAPCSKAFEIIHNVSSLTHAHKRSQIACGIYLSVACKLLSSFCTEESKNRDIKSGINSLAKKHYESNNEYVEELKHYERLFTDDFGNIPTVELDARNYFENLPEDDIRSSGYVVDTLEAALWCLISTDSYESCVLKAVNLGEDTDTVAAIAGGLAGMLYGVDSIPKKWLNQIVRLDYIEELCDSFYSSLQKMTEQKQKASAQKLCEYIPYFENIDLKEAYTLIPHEKNDVGSISIPDYRYSGTFSDFISEWRSSGLLMGNYSEILDQRIPDWLNTDIMKVLETADFELTKAILTKCIRVERFCTGAWASAIEGGLFLAILRRLNTF